MKSALEAAGATYISSDAQNSAAKQLTDVEALIAQGAEALVILSVDKDAIVLPLGLARPLRGLTLSESIE